MGDECGFGGRGISWEGKFFFFENGSTVCMFVCTRVNLVDVEYTYSTEAGPSKNRESREATQ